MEDHGIRAEARPRQAWKVSDKQRDYGQGEAKPSAWLSVRVLLMLAILLGIVFSLLIPPQKSPDEGDHLRRAYLLSQGQFFLYTEPCAGEGGFCQKGRSMSGGPIDTGLLAYLQAYDPAVARKDTEQRRLSAGALRWTGEEAFALSPGTGYYFPFVYFPQAMSLGLAKAMGLGLDLSYRLVRISNLIFGVAILALAFFIWKPPVFVMALLLLPMSLFQAMSASIDLSATAIAILAISCYQRIHELKSRAPLFLFVLLCVSLFLAITARAHLGPMLLLAFVAAWWLQKRLPWVIAFLAVVAVGGWMATVIPMTVDFRVLRAASTGEVALYYLSEPVQLIQVFTNTLGDPVRLKQYTTTALGVFFDVFLNEDVYRLLLALLIALAAVSLPSMAQLRGSLVARGGLLVCAGGSAFLAFLAMLLTWTPHPAQVIEGVQGRYFLVSVILLGVACLSWFDAKPVFRRLQIGLIFCLLCLSLHASVDTLVKAFLIG